MTREQIWTLRIIAGLTLVFIGVTVWLLVDRVRDVFF